MQPSKEELVNVHLIEQIANNEMPIVSESIQPNQNIGQLTLEYF
jgi:hypothetical protein